MALGHWQVRESEHATPKDDWLRAQMTAGTPKPDDCFRAATPKDMAYHRGTSRFHDFERRGRAYPENVQALFDSFAAQFKFATGDAAPKNGANRTERPRPKHSPERPA
jgi:hypothetical protein